MYRESSSSRRARPSRLLPAMSPSGAAATCHPGQRQVPAVRWLRRLRSLSRSTWEPLQSCMSTSSAGNLLQHGRSPSKLVMQAAHLLQRGSPLQRLGIDGGPQQRPQLLAALQDVVVIPNFLMSKKIGCGIGRNYSGHLRDGGSTRRSVTSRLAGF